MAEHSAGSDHQTDPAQVLARCPDFPRILWASVPAQRDRQGQLGEPRVDRPVVLGRRQAAGIRRPRGGFGSENAGLVRRDETFGHRCLDHSWCAPANAEIALDSSGAPHDFDDFAVQRGFVGVGCGHRVRVGRGSPDVDDDHVPDAGHVGGAIGQHLDPGQDGVGRRGTNHGGETR
jgi:hypothetical protein